MLVELNKDNFSEYVSESPDLVIVDFWSTRCSPCRLLKGILAKREQTLPADITVCTLNVDDVPEYAQAYSVSSLPTLLFFKKGELVKRAEGMLNAKTLDKIIEEAQAS